MILAILKSKLAQFALVGLISVSIGAYINHKVSPPETITTIIHDTKEIKVEVPVLTTKIVDHLITDSRQQAAIKILMKENDDLKLRVIQLTSTIAENHTGGGTDPTNPSPGTITLPQVDPSGQGGSQNPSPTNSSVAGHYTDYQLDAHYTTTTFNYELNQTFLVTTTTGKDSQGNPTGIVRLFQDTPTGLTPIAAKTTVIHADENLPRWFVSPRIQGGLGIDQDKVKSGFVGLQLLKRGRSSDPKDIKFSLGTIGAKFDAHGVEPLLFPISVNLGSLPHQPFSNLWLSPSVHLKKQVGLFLTATF